MKKEFQNWNMAFDQGQAAFDIEKTLMDCPYEIGSDRHSAWIMGFEESEMAGHQKRAFLQGYSVGIKLIPFTFCTPFKGRLFEDGWLPGAVEGMEDKGIVFRA